MDATDEDVAAFAADLRRLREGAGAPAYRVLAGRAHYSVATLSDAASGRRLPTLEVALAYVQACGGDAAEWEQRWHAVAAAVERKRPEVPSEASPPYVGLAAFGAEDADRFFGRGQLVEDVLAQLKSRRFLALLGASGSGKSSVLGAGLVPRWRSGPSVVFTPGQLPEATLHRLVGEARADGELLVVIDQFEEVFTLCHSRQERERFLTALVAMAAEDRTRIVIGLRSDFYAHCADHPELFDLLNGAQVLVGAMTAEQLRAAIVQPAQQAGYQVEGTLVATLVAEAAGEAGALPLVSHALLQTWHRRRGNTLTLAGYRAAGQIQGALAQTGEQLYTDFDVTQQHLLKQVLLRLIEVGHGTSDTKRRLPRGDLGGATLDLEAVVTALARTRLISLDHDTVELTHEALITAWPRLSDWLAEDRDGLRIHRQVTEASADWDALGRDPGALYRGTRLVVSSQWANSTNATLTSREREFLRASENAEQRRRRWRRLLTSVGAVLLVLAVASSVVAVVQRQEAQAQLTVATSRELAAKAMALSETTPARNLLAVKAFRQAPTLEARSALLSLTSQPYPEAIDGPPNPAGGPRPPVTELAFSPDGRTFASADIDGDVRFWDFESHERFPRDRADAAEAALTFSPDGRTLAGSTETGEVKLWDAATGRETATLTGSSAPGAGVAFSPDGHTLAFADRNGVVKLWNTSTLNEIGTLTGDRDLVTDIAFSPDGRTLATSNGHWTVKVWDTVELRELTTLTGHTGFVSQVAFSADGRVMATASGDGTAKLWDTGSWTTIATLSGHAMSVDAMALSPDGRTLVTGGMDHTLKLWDVATAEERATLTGHRDRVSAAVFSPDGQHLVSSDLRGDIRRWNLDEQTVVDRTCAFAKTLLEDKNWREINPGPVPEDAC